MRILENYSLLKHNTFNLDVKTRWFIEYENEEDLSKLLQDEYFHSQAFWHIGQGSNLLFLDNFNGIIIHSAIKGIEKVKEDNKHIYLKVGAAETFDDFVAYCVDNGLGGIENLSNIPGEVGASAFQNIGAYGVEAGDRIEEVHTYSLQDSEKEIFQNEDCEFSYRHSIFKNEELKGWYYITHVVYRLDKNPEFKLDYGNLRAYLKEGEPTLQSIREAVISLRASKLPDPTELGNAGSFFMNPYLTNEAYFRLKEKYSDIPFYPVDKERVKVPAAWLIDRAGLKGKTLGGAKIHEKQPLVIINTGTATGKDIADLAEEVKKTVLEQFGIELHPEVNYI